MAANLRSYTKFLNASYFTLVQLILVTLSFPSFSSTSTLSNSNLQEMAGFSSTLYNSIFKRTSTLLLVSVVTVFFFERTFDLGSEYYFETVNKGKLWKDVKDKFNN